MPKEFEVVGTITYNFCIDVEARNEDDAMSRAEALLETEAGLKEVLESELPDITVDEATSYD